MAGNEARARQESRDARRRHATWAQAVCACLAVVAVHDEEVIWQEIAAANGGYQYLRGVSKRAGNLRIDGFTRYKAPRPYRAALAATEA